MRDKQMDMVAETADRDSRQRKPATDMHKYMKDGIMAYRWIIRSYDITRHLIVSALFSCESYTWGKD